MNGDAFREREREREPLHTRDWEPVTNTIQALSLVETWKGGASPSSLHTTPERPTEYVNAWWMWSLHRLLHGIKWIMFHGHFDYFQIPPLGGRPNRKSWNHGTLNAHNRWFTLLHHVWGPAWIETHWNSTWLRARSHMTSHYTGGSVTTLHDFGGVLGRWPLDTYTPPTHTGAWPPANGEYQQGLQPMALTG